VREFQIQGKLGALEMSDLTPASQSNGVVPVEAMRPVEEGWTIEALREHLGPPLEVRSADETPGPTDTFSSLGFTVFDFAVDRDLSEVWVYKHDRRGKFRLTKLLLSFVGIRDGKVTGVWQEQRDQAPNQPIDPTRNGGQALR